MTVLTEPITVAELRARLDGLPDDRVVWVHASNGWGPGQPRALHKVVNTQTEVHLYGAWL